MGGHRWDVGPWSQLNLASASSGLTQWLSARQGCIVLSAACTIWPYHARLVAANVLSWQSPKVTTGARTLMSVVHAALLVGIVVSSMWMSYKALYSQMVQREKERGWGVGGGLQYSHTHHVGHHVAWQKQFRLHLLMVMGEGCHTCNADAMPNCKRSTDGHMRPRSACTCLHQTHA